MQIKPHGYFKFSSLSDLEIQVSGAITKRGFKF